MSNKRDLISPLHEKTDQEKLFAMTIEALKMSHRLDNGRHFLMSFDRKKNELTVEDCLEAFGFTKEGRDAE